MNNSKRQQKQTNHALAKKTDVPCDVPAPLAKPQPQYPVPADLVELRDQQSADWSLDRDIEILRMYIALETQKGGNGALVAQLAKQVESLIRTNASMALRTGEWLSRSTTREILLGTADDIAELIREHVPDDDVYSDLLQELKRRMLQRITREAVAAANERNENL